MAKWFRDLYSDGSCTSCGKVHSSFLCPKPTPKDDVTTHRDTEHGEYSMSNRETALQTMAQAVDDIGAASTNLQAADDWLEAAAERNAEDLGGDTEIVGKLQAAKELAEEAIAAVAAAGVALEAFKEALEGLE